MSTSAPGSVPALKRIAPLLRLPQFKLQFSARALSNLGTGMAPVALSLGVLQETHSASVLAWTLSSHTVSMLVFVMIGGAYSDRLPRNVIMGSADALRFCTQLTFGALLLTHNTWLVLLCLLQAINGIGTAFAQPASAGLTVLTVPPEHRQSANALLSASRNVSMTVGPAIAGAIVVGSGAGWALIFDACTFGASALLLLRLRLPAARRRRTGSLLGEIRSGWITVVATPWLLSGFALAMFINLAYSAVQVLGPAAGVARGAPVSWALVVGAIGGGSILGDLVAMHTRPRRPILSSRVVLLGVAPLPVLVIGRFPTVLVVAAALLAGAALSYSNSVWLTEIQDRMAGDDISKISSYDWLVSGLLRPAGFALAAAGSNLIGLDDMARLSASLIVGAVLVALIPATMRARERRADGSDEPTATNPTSSS